MCQDDSAHGTLTEQTDHLVAPDLFGQLWRARSRIVPDLSRHSASRGREEFSVSMYQMI